MFSLDLIDIRPALRSDDDELYAVVDANREYLKNLTWAANATPESIREHLLHAMENERFRVITHNGFIIGCITFRPKGDEAELGYWLAHGFREKGVMKRALKLALRYVECDVTARVRPINVASKRVLENNGFVVVSADAEWLHFRRAARFIKNYKGAPYPINRVLDGVGKGWHGLVLTLIDDLWELGWDGQLMQIKEKFAGLRFYIGAAPDAVHERIRKAEDDSYTICEVCGSPGHHRDTNWERTLCDEHYKEQVKLDQERGW